MTQFFRRCWTAAPVATVLLVLALTAATLFGGRMLAQWIYWNDPAHRDQAVAGWMTPGYIAHSWNVPRGVILQALDAPRDPDGPRNLDRLAREQGRPLADLVAEAETAIAAFRAGTLPPPDSGRDGGTRP